MGWYHLPVHSGQGLGITTCIFQRSRNGGTENAPTLLPQAVSKHVIVRSDNTTVGAYLNRQGTTHPSLYHRAAEIDPARGRCTFGLPPGASCLGHSILEQTGSPEGVLCTTGGAWRSGLCIRYSITPTWSACGRELQRTHSAHSGFRSGRQTIRCWG